MRIGHHITVVVLVCSLGGLGLSIGLGVAHRSVEVKTRQLGPDSVAMKDAERLTTLVKQWLTSVDLVSGSRESYLIEGARAQAMDILQVVDELSVTAIAQESRAELGVIRNNTRKISLLLNEVAKSGPDRDATLDGFVPKVDRISQHIVEAIESLHIGMARQSELAIATVDHERNIVSYASWVTSIIYLFVIVLTWRWIRSSLVRPLEQLTDAAERSMNQDERFAAPKAGPLEVARLAESLSSLTDKLQEKVRERTAELRESMLLAEASNRAKSEFLANMSHEIRTPMTAILGFSENLADPNLEDAQRSQAIEIIRNNGENLLNIISDILDISKIEADRIEVENARVSPVQIVAEVVSVMRVRATAKGLSFATKWVWPLPETIESDPTRLKQILVNLVGNAIKFTESGGVRLEICHVDADSANPMIQFDIVDTGIGVTEEQAARLFQPFAQADTSTTRRFGGTGLGLAISDRLAKLLGGDITVQSKPGHGSRFRVRIATGPLDGLKMIEDPIRDIAATPDVPSLPQSIAGMLNCRILLAEDAPDNQRLISLVLNKAGANVTVKENGKLALDAALAARDEGHPFNVILMDMQMPVMDGYQATGQLRQKGYTGPIIALTAHALGGDREKCIKAGCDDYATKPIDRAKLIETMQRYSAPKEAALPAAT
ncbi:MAG: response regulator [Gemmatimonadetes bacterium]|nr:response regulator [Gemmatimonadota bacterium]